MTVFFDYSITFFEVYGIWCLLGLIGLFFAGLWIGTAIENKKSKEELKKPITKAQLIKTVSVMSIPFFGWLFISEINPNYLGYGYVTNRLDIVAQEGRALWAIDYYTSSSGAHGTSVVYRIQMINLSTGEKEFRKLIDRDYKVEGNAHGLVWISFEDELLGMNIFTGKTIKTINKTVLQQAIPELSGGVHEYAYNNKTMLVDVVSNDGLKLSVEPSALKVETPIEKDIRETVTENTILSASGNEIISLNRKGEREKLHDKNDEEVNASLFFLKGQFIAFDTIAQTAFIFSHKTLDKTNFLVRCVSTDGKLMWEASQDELNAGDFFEAQPDFKKAFLYDDSLIVALDGFVISLNEATGKLNWLTRL